MIRSFVRQHLRQHIPWRLQRMMRAEFYLKPLTGYVFRRVLNTPSVATDPHSPVDVLSLVDHSNVNNYLLAIKSLLVHLPILPAITVLSDGTLNLGDVHILKQHLPGIRVLTKVDVSIPCASAHAIEHWCAQYRYLAKLMYLPFTSDKRLLLFLDSDVMFRRELPASFLQLQAGLAATFNRDHEHSRWDPCFHYLEEYAEPRGISLIKNLNCGLMLWDRTQLRPLDAVEFLEYVVKRHGFLHPVAEQDAWTFLASQVRAEPLPLEFLVLSNWEYNDRAHRRHSTAIHYVSGERYRRLDYLRDGLRTMRLVNRSAGHEAMARSAQVFDAQPVSSKRNCSGRS
jgi:hypothetical protein